ncbi:MAG TPA: ATP-binding protein [Aggregatilineales bacterium]|nr:ATP-binding protein [Aggregatilineales bacterium]
MSNNSPLQRIFVGFLVLFPLVIFLALQFIPGWNPTFNNGVFHFYIVTFTCLIALVSALFVLSGTGFSGAQATFTAMAFMAISGIFLLHGAVTPGVLIKESGHGIGISARLSLTSGAILLALAVSNIGERWTAVIKGHQRALWLALSFLYVGYNALIFFASAFVTSLEQLNALSTILAVVTIGLLLWGAWRAWGIYQKNGRRLPLALAISLPWLAVAQLSQYLAATWTASWWLYHALMLLAFVVTMIALIMDYEQVLDFKVTRYFSALSVIVGVPLLALLSEAAVRLSGSEDARWQMFGFGFLTLLLLFVVLLIVVRRAEIILKERQLALEREKQWRVDFTNLIVHDLKNPLGVISVSLSLMHEGKLEPVPEKMKVVLERAQRGSRETLELVDNLLDIEKLEAGSLRLNAVQTDLKTLLSDSVDSVRALAEFYNINLETALPADLPSPAVDVVLLRRIVQNLLTNAIKFTPKGKRIVLAASRTPDGATITITDEGPGIPPQHRERIFEKFVQQSIDRRGVGLGLTFCKMAVEAHGGRIWVEDGPDGKGSRFVFTLPVRVAVPA